MLTFGPKNAALAGKSRIVTKRRYMRCFGAADAEKGDFDSRYCLMWWVSTSGCRVSKNIAICGIFCPVQLKQRNFTVFFRYPFAWAGDKNAAICDVSGLRMLKKVIFTVDIA